jgi:hypothetical protein
MDSRIYSALSGLLKFRYHNQGRRSFRRLALAIIFRAVGAGTTQFLAEITLGMLVVEILRFVINGQPYAGTTTSA